MTAPRLRIRIMGINYAPEQSGIAPYTTRLANALAEQGHDVQVLTSRPHYPEWRVQSGYEQGDCLGEVSVRRFRHYIPERPRWYRRVLFEVSFGLRLMFARWHRPDVVICVSTALISTAMVGLRVRLARHRPATGVIPQDLYSKGVGEAAGSGHSPQRLAASIEARVLGLFDGVVVIHERFKTQVTQTLGIPKSRVSVIRNWSHVSPERDFDVPEFRKSFGWGDETVVLHAGAMGVKQDLHNVVKAARIADSADASLRFVLLGDGSQRESLAAAADGIRCIEFRDQVDQDTFGRALVSADMLLVNEGPGLKEMAVPSKLTSYFRAGRPILAATGESSTTADELAAARVGVRVDPGKPTQLVDAALAIGTDPATVADAAHRGQEYCKSVLGEDAALASYDRWVSGLHDRGSARHTGRPVSRRRRAAGSVSRTDTRSCPTHPSRVRLNGPCGRPKPDSRVLVTGPSVVISTVTPALKTTRHHTGAPSSSGHTLSVVKAESASAQSPSQNLRAPGLAEGRAPLAPRAATCSPSTCTPTTTHEW